MQFAFELTTHSVYRRGYLGGCVLCKYHNDYFKHGVSLILKILKAVGVVLYIIWK